MCYRHVCMCYISLFIFIITISLICLAINTHVLCKAAWGSWGDKVVNRNKRDRLLCVHKRRVLFVNNMHALSVCKLEIHDFWSQFCKKFAKNLMKVNNTIWLHISCLWYLHQASNPVTSLRRIEFSYRTNGIYKRLNVFNTELLLCVTQVFYIEL